nr:putative F-box/LRR-repeat protein 23 [Tanacetum cinerariifolium]
MKDLQKTSAGLYFMFDELFKHVIDRSQGQLVDIIFVYDDNDALLRYVADRACELCIGDANEESLTSFNEIAIAIRGCLHDIRHLLLIGNKMWNFELQVLLDGCRHLETLDLRECFYIDLKGNSLTSGFETNDEDFEDGDGTGDGDGTKDDHDMKYVKHHITGVKKRFVQGKEELIRAIKFYAVRKHRPINKMPLKFTMWLTSNILITGLLLNGPLRGFQTWIMWSSDIFSDFNPSIKGFEHCRHEISIDGTHLYGKYKGKMMIAIWELMATIKYCHLHSILLKMNLLVVGIGFSAVSRSMW